MDVYFKKEIIYSYKGHKLVFDVANELFSTFAIDHGTDMLLRHIALNNPSTILDLGCGYGPIGISLAKTNPKAQVVLVDANLLAIRYSNINIQKNNVLNATTIGGVGMEKILDKKFDVIVSNVPAKIGDEAITEEFILTPISHLNPGGELWVVVVSALNRLIPNVAQKHHLEIALIRKRSGHSLYKLKRA